MFFISRCQLIKTSPSEFLLLTNIVCIILSILLTSFLHALHSVLLLGDERRLPLTINHPHLSLSLSQRLLIPVDNLIYAHFLFSTLTFTTTISLPQETLIKQPLWLSPPLYTLYLFQDSSSLILPHNTHYSHTQREAEKYISLS